MPLTSEPLVTCKGTATSRLSVQTRALAARALAGEFGRSMRPAGFSLDPAKTRGLTPNQHYAMATMAIAQQAPLRIVPGEQVVGAATLLEAAQHMMPLTDYYGTSHTTPGFEESLHLGYRAIRQRVERRLASTDVDEKACDLLQSMLICLDAASRWQQRNADLADSMATSATDAAQRQELQTLAQTLHHVPQEPPRGFREAVQSLWSLFAFQRLCGNWPGIGRIDKMLGGYLTHDLAAGIITLDEARELLAHFWIKGCEWIGNPHVSGSGDAQYYQNIVLAGVDEDGRPVLNDITWLILDIVEELHISDFPIAVRVNHSTSESLLRRIAQVQRHGGGIVAIYNEDVILPALERFGYTAQEARGFANDGCWEIIIPGKTAFSYSPFDTLKILQDSLGLPADVAPLQFSSFGQLYEAFRAGLAARMEEQGRCIDGSFLNGSPAPLLSLLIEGCIEKARGYHDRGARYTVMAPHAGGLADTANSLYVIKKAVFDDHLATWPALVDAIRADWQGHEPLRQQVMRRYALYGNDSAEADAMLQSVYNDYIAIGSQTPCRNGVLRPLGISTFGREIEWRAHRMATAFGRRAGEILATNLAPTPGSDTSGPTAVIKSFCSLDFTRLPNGVPLELKILPECVHGEAGLIAMVALLRSFVELGGVFLHIDVVDTELLRAAQRDPGKYPNLAVRISGWSARFATLERQWQDMIIQRTQQRM